MTDPFDSDPSTSDPFEVLRSHVRAVAVLERPSTDPDDLIAGIVALEPPNGALVDGSASNVVALRSPRRRRWLAAGGAVAIVVAGGAGVAAFRGEKPQRPNDGVVCRGSVDDMTAVVLGPTADPIGACGELWARGTLPDIDRAGPGVIPRLVVCTGSQGPLEVLPLDDLQSCADVGLADADAAEALIDPVAGLQMALTDAVNSQCLSADEAVEIVRRELTTRNLESWAIEVLDPEAECVITGVQPERSAVILRSTPSFSHNGQEKP
jgi:hypothetical protein